MAGGHGEVGGYVLGGGGGTCGGGAEALERRHVGGINRSSQRLKHVGCSHTICRDGTD